MKILFYDIEVSPNIGYTWEKYEQNVLSYVKEKEILTIGYKWANDRLKVLSIKDKSEKQVLKEFSKIINEADLIVAHNGDSFDQKFIRARLLYHKLPPIKRVNTIDTRKVAKAYFRFNGNGLEDLGVFLKIGRKYRHPGFDMWLGCLRGDKGHWREMIKYNGKDVILLEKIYYRMLPFMESHPNLSKLIASTVISDCPKCGSKDVIKKGFRANLQSAQQQWQCKSCKGWHLTRIIK